MTKKNNAPKKSDDWTVAPELNMTLGEARQLEIGIRKLADELWVTHPNNPKNKTR